MQLSSYERLYTYCPNCASKLVQKQIDGRPRLTCDNCNFIFWNNPKPVISVVLFRDEKVLLVQRAEEPLLGYWCLPGGFLEYDETLQEGATREVFEETGLIVNIQKLVGVYRIDNDPSGFNIDTIYSGTFTGDVALSHEHMNYRFFSKNQLPDLIAYKHREAIMDFYNNLTQMSV